MSTEKDFIEYLIFINRYMFLWNLIHRFPKRFYGFTIFSNNGSYELINENGNYENIDDLIDYELDLFLNDTGRGFYMQYLLGQFYSEEDVAEIISEGLEFRLIKFNR